MGNQVSESGKPKFVFVCCRKGSHDLCKQEIIENYPEWRFAFSRPGLMTFKLPEGHGYEFSKPVDLKSIFARTYGLSVGNAGSIEEVVEQVGNVAAQFNSRQFHYWNRADQDKDLFTECRPVPAALVEAEGLEFSMDSDPGQLVVDVIEMDPERWFIGVHVCSTIYHRWPGGRPFFQEKKDVVSRAFWKTKEGLLWSRLPLRKEDECIEVGASPGGSIQALLESGCKVIAIDPAKLSTVLEEHPRVVHLKKRGKEVRKNELSNARWLLADLNVAPKYTLDTVEDIVGNKSVSIKGMLLTLKLMDGIQSKELRTVGERVKGLGFQHVQIRQLSFDHAEVCLFALKQKAMLRH